MTGKRSVRRGPIGVRVSIGLLVIAGCMHAPPPPRLSESLRQELGRIGVADHTGESDEALDIPGRGRWSNVGRGAEVFAAIGGAWGGYAGIACTYLVVVCFPVAAGAGAVLGGVGGAVYGAFASETAAEWAEAERLFRASLVGHDPHQLIPDALATVSRSQVHAITRVTSDHPETSGEDSHYASIEQSGIDSLIEIREVSVNLIPVSHTVNPQRKLTLSAHVQLVRTQDGAVLDDRIVLDQSGPLYSLEQWTENDAERFGQEVVSASHRLAEVLYTEYFMAYGFPERIVSLGPRLSMHLKGLRALYPREGADHEEPELGDDVLKTQRVESSGATLHTPYEDFHRARAKRVDSLQPTFLWESFSDTSVTYDLRIWRAGSWGPDSIVYDRTGIAEAEHELEVPLAPSTPFYWSVRARFQKDGETRLTDWTRRSIEPKLIWKIMYPGISQVMATNEGYYVFITPPAETSTQP